VASTNQPVSDFGTVASAQMSTETATRPGGPGTQHGLDTPVAEGGRVAVHLQGPFDRIHRGRSVNGKHEFKVDRLLGARRAGEEQKRKCEDEGAITRLR
jgi:hypothetical protein